MGHYKTRWKKKYLKRSVKKRYIKKRIITSVWVYSKTCLTSGYYIYISGLSIIR